MSQASKSHHPKNLDRRSILIVEDERDLADMLAINLAAAGYKTLTARDGREGLAQAKAGNPDLILLDVMLPGLAGTEVAARVRADPVLAQIPIIMLTAKAEEVDELVGLAVGADDYITKPFSLKVLLARIETLLRRIGGRGGTTGEAPTLRLGEVELNTHTYETAVAGEAVRLTLTEFRVMAALIGAGGRVLSRHELVSKAIGPGIMVTDRTIDVHMTALRKKLGDQASLIHTVRGVGYRASAQPEPAA